MSSLLKICLCQIKCENWQWKYFLILPPYPNAKPMCLFCSECAAVVKNYICRHHIEKHQTFLRDHRRGTLKCIFASYNREPYKPGTVMLGPRENYSSFPLLLLAKKGLGLEFNAILTMQPLGHRAVLCYSSKKASDCSKKFTRVVSKSKETINQNLIF